MNIEKGLRDIESFDVCHLPIVSAFCDKIGLSGLIDDALNAQMVYLLTCRQIPS